MIDIMISNEAGYDLPRDAVLRVVPRMLRDHHSSRGEVSLAVVDDAKIHQLNKQYLDHDYPTDVLSFPWRRDDHALEGEVVVSWDTATRRAEECGWSVGDELLLYVIHGVLHLLGYDDQSEAQRRVMRRQEAEYLRFAGITTPAAVVAGRQAGNRNDQATEETSR